jgi:NAD(P)-dependent dehydrogenase (short-subunit alcohol dehydrogenase family)
VNDTSSYDFSGKSVLVTGASRGIGRAIAMAFAAGGARVAVNFRSDTASAQRTLEDLHGSGHVMVQSDVSTSEGSARAVDETVARLGRLDIAVNNAGIYESQPVASTGADEWMQTWRRIIETNLTGPAEVCFHAARHMIENGAGRIVNVSSRAAFRGEPDSPAYAASKGGLNAFSQSLARALAPFNIYVGVVAPGFVETDMAAELLAGDTGDSIRAQSPLGRVARPEEVAHAVLFLASPGAEFSTGTIIDVNGASYLRS